MMKANNFYLPVVFLLVIFVAIYFMYGDAFSTKQVNLDQYIALCENYRSDDKGQFSKDELNMLVSEINYIVPDRSDTSLSEQERRLANCAGDLQQKIQVSK